MSEITTENKAYWLQRAKGYSEVNKEELAGIQHDTWSRFLSSEITGCFPDREPSSIKVLDVGAGPGFISTILTEMGYQVTAVDFAETMLEVAKENAGLLAKEITYVQSDATELPFEKESYDVVFSRNLTWNLPDPKKAYDMWLSVLKPGGLMLVFDANWYTYLVDEDKRIAYDRDRENVKISSLEDYNIGENFDKMEQIAYKMPLTNECRPKWDMDYLNSIHAGMVTSQEDIGSILYSDKE
ncbi:MAG: class I SAM-dependent methyltransferase, partial [Pseudobutyrivibrio sp.]|nr:class I SAM-dependent methyltransferase [Pseudobutyrivibrio sp.]